jgi:hypothetical protein
VPEGQALLGGLIDSCFEIVQDIKAREAQDEVSPPLRPIYERLSQLVQQLEQLSEYLRMGGVGVRWGSGGCDAIRGACWVLADARLTRVCVGDPPPLNALTPALTHRWTLRETDLYK